MDVSKNTVLTLLVLTIVVSVVGTYSVLIGVDDVMREKLSSPLALSKVSISINDQSSAISGAVVKQTSDGSSYARFGLSKRGA